MTDFVALFPGQGSQSIGMMQNLASNPLIKKTFDEASDILKTNFWDMVNIENTDINQTINTQPLMLAAGIATWRVFKESNINHPSFAAGHSLGEFTALVAAEVFSIFTISQKLVFRMSDASSKVFLIRGFEVKFCIIPIDCEPCPGNKATKSVISNPY